ncbi:MAG TPA: glutaredoxin domain-containing protein [Syntrophales bacterium]|nr:glutaredoxin domain-containing protein [Syntrophales bacterium]
MMNATGNNRIIFFVLTLAALQICFASALKADMYKWVDENGELHITDTPPPVKSSGEMKVYKDVPDESSPQASGAAGRSEKPKPSVETRKRAEVELYTTSWCPYCRKARDYLRSRGIDFTEYDVEKDKEAAARKKQLDARGGVPFAIINGHPIRGFSASAYERALRE